MWLFVSLSRLYKPVDNLLGWDFMDVTWTPRLRCLCPFHDQNSSLEMESTDFQDDTEAPQSP